MLGPYLAGEVLDLSFSKSLFEHLPVGWDKEGEESLVVGYLSQAMSMLETVPRNPRNLTISSSQAL